MGQNTFEIDDKNKIARIQIVGDQTRESMIDIVKSSFKLMEVQNSQFNAVNTLADVTNMGSFDLGSKTEAIRSLGTIDIDRLAVVGATGAKLALIEMLVGVSSKQDIVKFFDDEESAIAWLTE